MAVDEEREAPRMQVIQIIISFLLGIICDWFLRDPITNFYIRSKRQYWLRKSGLNKRGTTNTFLLGNEDTHLLIINGDGSGKYNFHNIQITLDDNHNNRLRIPVYLREAIKDIARKEKEKKNKSIPYAWNGKMIHIKSFNNTRTPDKENWLLKITVQKGRYYHFMATTVAIHKDFDKKGFQSKLRNDLIGGFSNWRFDTPPNMLNGLPINLHVITETDNKIIFSKRSHAVAITPNVISAVINENLHPDDDCLRYSKKYDVENFILRSLQQEIGWKDKEHEGSRDDPKASTHILLFTIDIARVAYGLLGYTLLPISSIEFLRMFENDCGDRFETAEFSPIDFSSRAVCRFIHENKLYNSVGVGAIYSLIHRGGISRNIQKLFIELQNK